MNDCVEAGVGFVGAHCDALELLEFAEEVFDEMTPFVEFCIDTQRCGAPGLFDLALFCCLWTGIGFTAQLLSTSFAVTK
jgi:hypothetical protein